MDELSSNEPVQLKSTNQLRARGPGNNENGQLAVDIIPLPAELIYDILDYLSVEDIIAFVFCRWNFFQASVGFLTHKVGPTLQNLDSLVEAFKDKHWPKQWLWDLIQKSTKSGKSSLRGFNSLLALFKKNEWPENVLRDIVSACASRGLPISHSCLHCKFHEGAILYLQKDPRAILDTNESQMTVLHVSILFRATKCVEAIEVILRGMAEPDRVSYVNELDDFSHTALDYAVNISPVTVIDALIRSGAEFDNHDKLGFTPLMNACHLGRDKAIHCLLGHSANVTATNNFNQSALENIMMGDSKSKHSLLKRLGPRANQDQLNRALFHTFNSDKEFVGVLIECGAEAQYLGLSEDVVPIRSVDPQSSTHMQQDSELLRSESVAESRTSRMFMPQSRNSSIDLTERDSVNEGENDAHNDHIFSMMGTLTISDEHRRVDAWCYIGTGCFSIMRIGPLETCTYVFEKAVYGNTDALQNVSDSQNRISNITFTDEMGYTHRLYGRGNIEGIVGVVVAERPPWKSFRRASTTYVKIKWTGISYRHSGLCLDNCS